ncbi:ankyrin repeat-containing domain protein [Mucor lusitanicus]
MLHSISKSALSKVSSPPDLLPNIRKTADSMHANTDEEDDDDMVNYKPQKKKRSRLLTHSSSPEPAAVKKSLKKAYQNPNRKDKAGRTKIFSATTAGHLDKVKELVDCGADVNFKDNAGWTPLHEAALKGQYEIADYLIQQGAEVNVRGFGLDTPLHDACNSNSPECVQLLVDAGADVFALNEAEKRPIDVCTDATCQRIVEIRMKQLDQLLARDNDGRSSLHRACLANKLEKVQSLIKQGADVHAKDNEDATPLHLSCACGHVDIVKLLIDQDAIINILGTHQMDTPLHEASRHGHEEIVRLLIAAGADVNMEDKAGNKPYHVSAAFPTIRQMLTARMDEVRLEKEACNALDEIASKTASRNEPVRQLTREERKIQNYLRTFANMDSGKQQQQQQQQQLDEYTGPITLPKRRKRTTSRRKSLSVESDASASKKANVVKLDASKKDTSGRTHLHKYAKRGDVGSVEALLELGADANEKDYAGWTALHEAALNGHLKVVKLLLKYGADVNSKGADLDTPLHDATENNHCDIVELLLERGADPFARNVHDAEPIDIATEHEYQDIMLVLQAANPVVKKKRNRKVLVKKEDISNDNEPIATDSVPLKNASNHAKPHTKKQDDEEEDLDDIPLPRRRRKHSRNSDSDLVEVKQEPGAHGREALTRSSPLRHAPPPPPSKKNLFNVSTASSLTQSDIPAEQQQLHSPIHTPPPENWGKERECNYTPLYTVQANPQSSVYYLVDLQVSLFLGLSLEEFWSSYSYLTLKRTPVHSESKARLWPTLNSMIRQDKAVFIESSLYFIPFDDIVDIIKRDFSQLSDKILTITLDIGHSPEPQEPQKKKLCSLPPKIAMKMKKCGYKFQQYTTSTS